MKLRIELDYDINIPKLKQYHNVETYKEYYEKYYKKRGFKFNEDQGVIYYDTDVPFMPIEGQRVGTKFGNGIVKWAVYELGIEGDSCWDMSIIIIKEE